MEWSDIRVFLQVVREGTMAAATHVLRMDHSTISRRILRLERETGVPLFERAGRRLTLTREGEKLVGAAERLESIVLQEVMSLSADVTKIAGQVRIGTTEEFGTHYLASRLHSLTEGHPDLEIELLALPKFYSLATREVDVVVTVDRPLVGDVRYKKLVDFEIGIYGSRDYFGDRERPTSVLDLYGETWCGYINELLATPETGLWAGTGVEIPAKYRTTSISVQLGAILGGYALAALPSFVASAHPALERILPAEIRHERTYWIAVHEDMAKSPRVRAVMGAIEATVDRDKEMFRSKVQAGVCVRSPQIELAGRTVPAETTMDVVAPGRINCLRGTEHGLALDSAAK